MSIHDWTRVDAGILHAFHIGWIAELSKILNGGLLPQGYYALPEQHVGSFIPDLLTLHASPALGEPRPFLPATGGTTVMEAPLKVQRRQTSRSVARSRRRTLAIRHVSEHRLVALIEIVSPANKDRVESVAEFAKKAVSALDYGVHVFLIDLLPPGKHDPCGMHGAIWQRLECSDETYDLPPGNPLTLASYAAGETVEIFLEHPTIGTAMLDMPLFLRPDRHVSVPLEATYCEAFRSMPLFWREILENKNPT